MKKKVYIRENNLIKLKRFMADGKISHKPFIANNKPPYEKDEFEICGEGGNNDYFHINENRLSYIDLSDVGAVNYEWYFDEDEYQEWLEDNELEDSDEVRNQYYTEEVTYGVEYVDNEAYHYMDGDQNLLYDDLVDLFGNNMAKQMLSNCIKNGSGSFETYKLYANNSYDLNSPNEVNDIAMKLFSHGEYYKDCRGFILSNGVVVYTPSEHNKIRMIPGVNDKFDFVEMGNIRVLPNSIDIGVEPTYEQEKVLRQVISSYSDEELRLDIFDNGGEIGVEYTKPNWRYVMGEIDRFYSEGIRPQGNAYYEGKEMRQVNEDYRKNISQKLIDRAIRLREYGQGNWCVIDNVYLDMMPRYFEKRSEAIKFKKWLRRGFLVNLDKYQSVNENTNKIPKNIINESSGRRFNLESVDRNNKKLIINENQLISLKESTFDKWFGSSILIDKDGNPIKMYHGTDAEFDEFSKEFIGKSGSYEGYGFNFTPFYGRAVSYNSKNVIEAYLKVENPMTSKSNKITLRQVVGIISELDKGKPFTDTIVAAYESPRYNENWDEIYYRRALPVAAKTIYDYNRENDYGDAGIYAEICLNGQADKIKTIEVFENLGYDSAIFYDNDDRINTVVVFEPNQIKRTSNNTFDLNSNSMNEKIDANGDLTLNESKNNKKKILVSESQLKAIKENLDLEVDSSEVDLSSFKKKHELAPNIWNPDGKLNSRVRLKLLDIADDFWNFTEINWIEPKGIHLTGSICNFNWSDKSDIDLHLVADFSEVDERKDFVEEYFNSKKNEWNEEHSNLKIFGYPVELYVEDVNADTVSSGVYDLEKNKWISEPSKDDIKEIGLDKYEIKSLAANIMTKVDDLYDEFTKTDDDAELREIGKRADKLLSSIKQLRADGLSRGGESDEFNIIYKVLKRTNYLKKLFDLKSELYDKLNSIGIDEEKIIKEYYKRFIILKEEVVADGSANHNPFKQRWRHEREALKNYLVTYGEIMTSKENGKEYKVLFDTMLSQRLGINYCICIQWNSMEMMPGNIIYVRAYDKFTRRRFKPQFDTRGFDNDSRTYF